ncbi:MAG: hypothetical protein E7573_06615 [Ruminococcaceae bacterium]|nr:hypothetical protein [Oscillospiraceae bacterium]MBR3595414.1 hypothetical protein [Clostridia bacterium]
MKTTKKIISLILALTLIFTVAVVPAFAAEDDGLLGWEDLTENDYPFVFVHGMGGWGAYEENAPMPYWGGMSFDGLNMSVGDTNIVDILTENGIETYEASVGPFSSAWDRACELYAQLTGTVVDYGAAHSEAHNHDRYGYSYEGKALMGENWDLETPINIMGHSFGGPTVRLFASLMYYGDEAEIAATGDDTSPLFTGGHDVIHSCTTFSSPNDGTPIADFLVDLKLIALIAFAGNLLGTFFGDEVMMWSLRFGHFGITPKEGEERAKFNLCNIMNFYRANDNCGYDMTIDGAKELNEKINVAPNTYYYSYTAIATEDNCVGMQKLSTPSMFSFSSFILSAYEGKTIDGVKMTKEWAISDGIVPYASAKCPMKDIDTAKNYSEAVGAGEEIEPGRWYMMDPLMDFQHASYMGVIGWPTSVEDFYVNYINTVNSR